MPTPKEGYYLKDGTRVPGVTTIIGRFKESGALIRWAFNQGKEGKDLYETRDKAADIGSAAHAMVEAQINGDDPHEVLMLLTSGPEFTEKAMSAFGAYSKWASMTQLGIVEQEEKMVSEQYRFGGTPDAIGKVDGELCLIDWKTSNSVYSDYLIQIAAYKHLWEENHPGQLITGGYHLCRFAKENGDFAHHYYPDLEEAWRLFLLFREAYDIDKVLRKRAN